MRKSYDITIERDGEEIPVKLRLTLGSQMALKKKYKRTAFATIMEAMDDAEVCADVLTEALTFKDNDNTIKEGAELYDLLVDNGYAGYEGIGGLLLSVAAESGIITESVKEKALYSVTHTLDSMFDSLFEDEVPEITEEPDEKNGR